MKLYKCRENTYLIKSDKGFKIIYSKNNGCASVGDICNGYFDSEDEIDIDNIPIKIKIEILKNI